jgi:hypothetical protein
MDLANGAARQQTQAVLLARRDFAMVSAAGRFIEAIALEGSSGIAYWFLTNTNSYLLQFLSRLFVISGRADRDLAQTECLSWRVSNGRKKRSAQN